MPSKLVEAPSARTEDEGMEFASFLAHEVRGPLTVILGNALLLQRRGAPDELTRNGLKDIREQAERLTRIIAGLLALTGTHLESEPLATGIVVRGVVELFRKQHPGRRLYLSLDTESLTMGVQSYVEEILENLLSNADKYSPQGETIDVEVHGSCSGVTIAVDDKGPGIALADRKTIFNLFVRLDQTAGLPGHGIGLALSKRLAEVMDGELQYEERLDGGSRFLLTLPVEAAALSDQTWLS